MKKERLLSIIVPAIIAFIIFHFLLIPKTVMSESMEPTLMTGEQVIYSGLRLSPYKRGDIIMFRFDDTDLCKRIIALPGETVEILDGYVYIDGTKLDEPYLPDGTFTAAVSETVYHVPEDAYFVLGDNRAHSYDSRYWDRPFVTKQEISARFLCRVSAIKSLQR